MSVVFQFITIRTHLASFVSPSTPQTTPPPLHLLTTITHHQICVVALFVEAPSSDLCIYHNFIMPTCQEHWCTVQRRSGLRMPQPPGGVEGEGAS